MAKGRRLTSSRSDRLLGTANYNNYYDYGHDHDHDHGYHENGNVPEVSEFREEDVWSMVDDTPTNHHQHNHHNQIDYNREWDTRATVESGRRRGSVTCHQHERHVGGLSLAFEDKTAPSARRILHQYGGTTWTPRVVGPDRQMATSAPINVPDWSKILRVNSVESMQDSDEDNRVGGDDSVMEPPHEYLARSRRKNAFSVFEGVGRTLKGRDMSRVRDAVWSQTGFAG